MKMKNTIPQNIKEIGRKKDAWTIPT